MVAAALLVMKWGGELTPAGRSQSERLGERLRRQVYVPYTVQVILKWPTAAPLLLRTPGVTVSSPRR